MPDMHLRTMNINKEADDFLQRCVAMGMAPSVSELIRILIYDSLPKLFLKYKEMCKLNRGELLTSVLSELRENGYTIKKKAEGRSRLCHDMGNPFWKRQFNGNGEVEFTKIGDW